MNRSVAPLRNHPFRMVIGLYQDHRIAPWRRHARPHTASGRSTGDLALAEAKLAVPRVPAGMVSRPRVMQALDADPGTSLTLVAAPAGYGKTLAVRQWCAGRNGALAWVTVDALDEDPLRFSTYVATAVDRVREGLGRGALQRLRATGVSVDAVIDALLDGLSSLRDELVLVLDDLDAIADADCMATLDHALDRLPPTVRVVAIGRRDPELSVARRRASGTLVELRADGLAFTTAEARALLATRCRVVLAERDVDLLRRQDEEGWPAVVMLAALWLERVPDPARALGRFGGDHRFVAEYLSAEVLDRLDPDVREFLLSAAVIGPGDAAPLRRGPGARRLRRDARPAGAGQPVRRAPQARGVVPHPRAVRRVRGRPAHGRAPGARGGPAPAGVRVAAAGGADHRGRRARRSRGRSRGARGAAGGATPPADPQRPRPGPCCAPCGGCPRTSSSATPRWPRRRRRPRR